MERKLEHVAFNSAGELALLIGRSVVEKLLDDVVAKHVRHELEGVVFDFLKERHALLFRRYAPLELLLNEAAAVLILGALDDVPSNGGQGEGHCALVGDRVSAAAASTSRLHKGAELVEEAAAMLPRRAATMATSTLVVVVVVPAVVVVLVVAVVAAAVPRAPVGALLATISAIAAGILALFARCPLAAAGTPVLPLRSRRLLRRCTAFAGFPSDSSPYSPSSSFPIGFMPPICHECPLAGGTICCCCCWAACCC